MIKTTYKVSFEVSRQVWCTDKGLGYFNKDDKNFKGIDIRQYDFTCEPEELTQKLGEKLDFSFGLKINDFEMRTDGSLFKEYYETTGYKSGASLPKPLRSDEERDKVGLERGSIVHYSTVVITMVRVETLPVSFHDVLNYQHASPPRPSTVSELTRNMLEHSSSPEIGIRFHDEDRDVSYRWFGMSEANGELVVNLWPINSNKGEQL